MLVELAEMDGAPSDLDPKRLTDTWIVEKSLQMAEVTIRQLLDTSSVRSELRGLFPDDGFDDLDDER